MRGGVVTLPVEHKIQVPRKLNAPHTPSRHLHSYPSRHNGGVKSQYTCTETSRNSGGSAKQTGTDGKNSGAGGDGKESGGSGKQTGTDEKSGADDGKSGKNSGEQSTAINQVCTLDRGGCGSKNRGTYFSSCSFEGCQDLTELDLSDKMLKGALPAELATLTKLSSLCVGTGLCLQLCACGIT